MMNERRNSLSIAVPVYNERRTIRQIVQKIKAVPREKEILIVDDFSTDGTRRILQEFRGDSEIRIFLQPSNQGKGAALQRAFEAATKDVIVVQDADLEYDPADYEVLLRPIDRGLADAVYGSRFLHGERRVLFFWHMVGNRLLTTFSNMVTDLNLTDMETCYKAVRREILQNIRLTARRFGFEPEITAKLARLGCTIYEVPINYYGRSYAQGKKITWKDGVAALWHITYYCLSRKSFVKDQTAIDRVLVDGPAFDDTGLETLHAFESARNYNRWVFSRFRSEIGPRVLEVGSGIGNIVAELLEHPEVEEVVATDLSEGHLQMLRDRFGEDPRVSCHVWDANRPAPEALREKPFDSIICSNVLEHIEDHVEAVRQMRNLLKEEGRLILLVPAHPSLYSGLDEELGHFRRYDRKGLAQLMSRLGFEQPRIIDHNTLGAAGWWWSGKIRRRRRLNHGDVRLFDRMVPLIRPFDGLLCRLFGGVSLIAVAQKTGPRGSVFATGGTEISEQPRSSTPSVSSVGG